MARRRQLILSWLAILVFTTMLQAKQPSTTGLLPNRLIKPSRPKLDEPLRPANISFDTGGERTNFENSLSPARLARKRQKPLALRTGYEWRDIATTFEPAVPPILLYLSSSAPLDYNGVAEPEIEEGNFGDLWHQYHKVNERWWARLDYMNWRIRGYDVPELVTSSPAGTALNVAGVLGQPTTELLFGNQRLASGWRSGGRVRLGKWLVDGQFKGYQLEYFGFGNQGDHFSRSSTSTGDILARPVFNININAEDADLLNGPGLTFGTGVSYNVDGAINIDSSSNVNSFNIMRRHIVYANFQKNYRIDWLFAYRYFQLSERLRIGDRRTLRDPSGGIQFPSGTILDREDVFRVANDFHGGEVGLMGEFQHGKFSLEVLGKVAIGNMHQTLDINGRTNTIFPGGGGVATQVGGLLTQPNQNGDQFNIGRQTRDAFTLMPEVNLDLSYWVNDHMRVMIGGNFLYINRVARPGDAIDRRINPAYTSAGDPVAPQRKFPMSYFWAYGVNGTIEFRY